MGGAGPEVRVAASVPLTRASYQKCSRELLPGEVKRVMQRGPLVSYFIACPACGLSAAYLHSAVGFREEPPAEVPLRQGEHRALVGVGDPPDCYRCRRVLVVVDGRLEAHEDADWRPTPGVP